MYQCSKLLATGSDFKIECLDLELVVVHCFLREIGHDGSNDYPHFVLVSLKF